MAFEFWSNNACVYNTGYKIFRETLKYFIFKIIDSFNKVERSIFEHNSSVQESGHILVKLFITSFSNVTKLVWYFVQLTNWVKKSWHRAFIFSLLILFNFNSIKFLKFALTTWYLQIICICKVVVVFAINSFRLIAR